MPALVIRGDESFLVLHDARALLRTRHHSVDGFVEGFVGQFALALTCGQQRRFVQNIRQIRTGVAGGLARENLEVDVFRHRLVLRVDGKNLGAPLRIGGVHLNLTVETARAQQRGVEDVGTVRRRNHDDVDARFETIHFDEKLIESLFTLVVPTAHTGAAVAADGVNLVNEDDCGRVLLCDVEQVADAARTDTDEHFDEV